MDAGETRRAVEAATSTASKLGLRVDNTVVLHNSNRIAVRLTPCDALARVGPASHQDDFEFEVEVARRLTAADSPVGELEPRVEPRVHTRDGFVVTLWTYYEPVEPPELAAAAYAQALARLHAGLRRIDLDAPSFADEVAHRRRLVAETEQTPDLPAADREFLANALDRLIAAIGRARVARQLLHGEPHPDNVLNTKRGPLFVDLGTCCRGPVEYDLAFVPEDVAARYPGVDGELVQQCRALQWAMFAALRWSRDDQLPNRSYWRAEGLNRVRAAL